MKIIDVDGDNKVPLKQKWLTDRRGAVEDRCEVRCVSMVVGGVLKCKYDQTEVADKQMEVEGEMLRWKVWMWV